MSREVVAFFRDDHEAQVARDRKTARALQAAWAERAEVHEMLTKEKIPPGDLLWRVTYLIAQLRTGMDPWSEKP